MSDELYANPKSSEQYRVCSRTKKRDRHKHYRVTDKQTPQRTCQSNFVNFLKQKNPTNQNAPKCRENGVTGTGETQHLTVTNNFAHRRV